jgi:hypothetical protein
MKFCRLRVAWSVAWGVAFVALVALWVRSYSYDFWHFPITSQLKVDISSRQGLIGVSRLPTAAEFRATAAGWGQPAPNITSVHLGNVNFRAMHLGNAVVVAPQLAISLVEVPYWSLCAIAAVAGGVAWLPWSRRFSLRTVFFVTTFVAVVLGLVECASRVG